LGTAPGWALARWLVSWLGPSPDLDSGALVQAARTAAVGLLAALVLLAVVAAVRSRGATERSIGSAQRRLALLPWELLLLVAALGSYLQLRDGDAVTSTRNVAHVNLLLISFPLLFLAGAAVFTVRLLTALLPLLRRRSAVWSPALYVAARRVAAARLISSVLLVAVSLPVGVLAYASTLTGSAQLTLESKASQRGRQRPRCDLGRPAHP